MRTRLTLRYHAPIAMHFCASRIVSCAQAQRLRRRGSSLSAASAVSIRRTLCLSLLCVPPLRIALRARSIVCVGRLVRRPRPASCPFVQGSSRAACPSCHQYRWIHCALPLPSSPRLSSSVGPCSCRFPRLVILSPTTAATFLLQAPSRLDNAAGRIHERGKSQRSEGATSNERGRKRVTRAPQSDTSVRKLN